MFKMHMNRHMSYLYKVLRNVLKWRLVMEAPLTLFSMGDEFHRSHITQRLE